MKIAYLILAHSDIEYLSILIDKLKYNNSDIYVHIDKKSQYREFKNKDAVIISNRNIYWGGFSIVEATIDLIYKARESNKGYDYYILLSGDSHPLKNQRMISEFFKKNYGKEYIGCTRMPQADKPIERVTKYYLEGAYRSKSVKSILKKGFNFISANSPFNKTIPDEYKNYEFYAGSQWWALTDKSIDYIINFIEKNPKFINMYRTSLVPDEMFFQTILMNSRFKNSIEMHLMYYDWEIGPGPFPSIINKKHISGIKTARDENSKLFARKFNSINKELLNEIYQE